MSFNKEVYLGVKMADKGPGLFLTCVTPTLYLVCLKWNSDIAYQQLES